MGVLVRLWAWQVWRRTVRRPVLIRCAEGSLLLAPSWSRVGAIIAGTGLTERDDAIFALDLLHEDDLFVDVGANIGFYPMLAARRGARVVAYEPTPEAADSCERSVRINGLERLATVHRLACGASSGLARFSTGLDVANHLLDTDDDAGVEVALSTLDEQLAELATPGLSMLKVDAEGHDMDVLRGARRGGGNSLLLPDARIDQIRERLRGAQRPALTSPTLRWAGREALGLSDGRGAGVVAGAA